MAVKNASGQTAHSTAATLNEIEDKVSKAVAGLLNIKQEELDANKAFREVGLNFKSRGQLINIISETFNVKFNALQFYDYPTVKELSVYLFEKQQGEKEDNEINTHAERDSLDIAVIGISCKFSRADNIRQFWQNLKDGVNCIDEISKEHWGDYSWYDPNPQHEKTSYNKWGGFINDSDKFDPLFFGISPVEAITMDPQQRLFLEESWKAIEDAGYNPESLRRKKVGVFVGADAGDYLHVLHELGGDKAGAVFTGTSQAILAARISYFMNLTGPALAIDTACSSSLVAVDRACQSIFLRESEMALAGGVYLMNTPTDHIWASQVGMLSKGKSCKAFDDSADGIALGEGVGVIVLKRLDQAEKDGDHIYAVIKGSGINQDGKTNGITAPSAVSQKELELSVYHNYNIDPSTIGYVETHGTGTRLGDPIEVNALIESFGKYTEANQYCAIGSVKTNIGHTAFAAGIAGFIKAVLMLKNQQYVASLHFNKANAEIDFNESPFYVNTELKEWKNFDNTPRRAAISSFGFSGTNAHMIVEEYIAAQKEPYQSTLPAVVVLSARNAERLKQQVENLKQYLHDNPSVNIYDLAYTLQTGREAMDERLAVVAQDANQLLTQLTANSDVYTGNIKKEKLDLLLQGVEIKDPRAFAQLWVKGVNVDWNTLYAENRPLKISLPTYPFARETYWIKKQPGLLHKATEQLHPLLHRNDSDFTEQKYTSEFSGSENFFTHHKVNGQKILPGVAYLEMAREAGTLALKQDVTQIKNVTWLSPLQATKQQVHIRLSADGEQVDYEVYTEEILHSQGTLSTAMQTAKKYNINSIRQRLLKTKTGDEYYSLFEKAGLQYGNSFQGIQELHYSNDEVLSKISVAADDNYVLPPGLLDSALQSIFGMQIENNTFTLLLPYSVNEVNIYAPLPGNVWCYARKNNNSYDIDLLDDEGQTLLSFKELIALPLGGSELKEQNMLYVPVWERVKNIDAPSIQPNGKHLFVTGNMLHYLKTFLESKNAEVLEVDELKNLPANVTDVYLLQGLREKSKNYRQEELSIFNSLKVLMASAEKELNITVFTKNTQKVLSTDIVEVTGSGIPGLIGSLAKEQTNWRVRMIDIDSEEITAEKILSIPYNQEGAVIAFRNGYAYERYLYPLQLPASGKSKIKKGGTYVILGGAGGIGKVTTNFLASQYNAQVIWLGRRAADEKIIQSQDEIAAIGKRPLYIQCDANDKDSLQKAAAGIKASHPKINGLFHSAIVLHDMLLQNMSEADFLQSFDAKSISSHYFIDAFKAEPLDFICFYSSVQSQWTAPGQANYAAGCTYKDSYAYSLTALNIPVYIINWGYWGEVGVVSAPAYRQRMAALGVDSITAQEGMHILETVLANNNTQTIAIKLIHDKQD